MLAQGLPACGHSQAGPRSPRIDLGSCPFQSFELSWRPLRLCVSHKLSLHLLSIIHLSTQGPPRTDLGSCPLKFLCLLCVLSVKARQQTDLCTCLLPKDRQAFAREMLFRSEFRAPRSELLVSRSALSLQRQSRRRRSSRRIPGSNPRRLSFLVQSSRGA